VLVRVQGGDGDGAEAEAETEAWRRQGRVYSIVGWGLIR
jgi:hypothetical protein